MRPGEYLELARQWQNGDEIALHLDMGLRYEAGDLEQYGKAADLSRADSACSDSRFNKPTTPTIDVAQLGEAKVVPIDDEVAESAGEYKPWIVVDLPDAKGRVARLIDFASAGATTIEGKPLSQYVSWLPATGLRPPRPVAWQPADRAKVRPGADPLHLAAPGGSSRRTAAIRSADRRVCRSSIRWSCVRAAPVTTDWSCPPTRRRSSAAERRTIGNWSRATSTARRRASPPTSSSRSFLSRREQRNSARVLLREIEHEVAQDPNAFDRHGVVDRGAAAAHGAVPLELDQAAGRGAP